MTDRRPPVRPLSALAPALAGAALGCVLLAAGARPASAAIETNPQALYAQMTQAYAEGAAGGWTFDRHRYYASAVYATGRSYSLFRKSDLNYPGVALLTVDVASTLHYDPLNSEDGAEWWVREAANYALAHDPTRAAAAGVLLARLDAVDGAYDDAARVAQGDAAANVAAFHGDAEARVEQAIVELRAATVSGDPVFRTAALRHAADPRFPLVRLPAKRLQELYAVAQGLIDDANAPADDRAAAKALLARRDATPELQEIGSVTAVRHAFRLSITAPADEYFGRGGMSVLGIRNEIARLRRYLDAGYGAREAGAAVALTGALTDVQRTYPRDFELPRLIELALAQLGRVDETRAQGCVRDLARMLVLNYPESPEALRLLERTGQGRRDAAAPPAAVPALAAGPRALPDIAQRPRDAAAGAAR